MAFLVGRFLFMRILSYKHCICFYQNDNLALLEFTFTGV